MSIKQNVIGLFPAAGHGTRLSEHITGSKEMVDVCDLNDRSNTVPVGSYLLRQFQTAGIKTLVLLRRAEKQDLFEYGQGAGWMSDSAGACVDAEPNTEPDGPLDATSDAAPDAELIDMIVGPTAGTPHTLSKGCERFAQHIIATGFPDIIMHPDTLIREALARLHETQADICLGLARVADELPWDRPVLDGQTVTELHLGSTHSGPGWALCCWTPRFSRFLRSVVKDAPQIRERASEISLGQVFQRALSEGFRIESVSSQTGLFFDVGTPERLAIAKSWEQMSAGKFYTCSRRQA